MRRWWSRGGMRQRRRRSGRRRYWGRRCAGEWRGWRPWIPGCRRVEGHGHVDTIIGAYEFIIIQFVNGRAVLGVVEFGASLNCCGIEQEDHMEKDKITEENEECIGEEAYAIELVMFQVSDCYVYMVVESMKKYAKL